MNGYPIEQFRRFLPFLSWLPELKQPGVLRADLIAGITVALVLVPQSMAYAQLAGLPPYYGLYASFLPGIMAALFGSSRQLATGPVAVVSLMTAATLEPFALNPESYLAYAVALALLVGVIQITLGVLRMGVLVDLLSHPVVIGFTNAAAIIIATSQLSKLFGVTVERAPHHYETVWRVLVAAVDDTHMATFGMGILALAIIIVLRRFAPKVPAVLVAVVITTLLSRYTGFEQSGGHVVGKVPESLPSLSLPDIGMAEELITAALIIALLGFMEGISIAKAMAAKTRHRIEPNQELLGQGVANVASSICSGYAIAGSFSRSAVNLSAGAITGFSSVVAGLVVGATLLWMTPLLYHIPQATLAAVIIMAVVNLVQFEPIVHAWKAEKHDGIVAVVTLVLTLMMAPHLETGIGYGVLLSMVLLISRTMRPRVAVLARYPDGSLRDAEMHGLDTCRYITILRFDMYLYFGNAGYFETQVLDKVASKPELRFIIINAEGINQIDATGAVMLCQMVQRLHEAGIEVYFARGKRQVLETLKRSGAFEKMGEHRFVNRVQHGIDMAFEKLGDDLEECSPLTYDWEKKRAQTGESGKKGYESHLRGE